MVQTKKKHTKNKIIDKENVINKETKQENLYRQVCTRQLVQTNVLTRKIEQVNTEKYVLTNIGRQLWIEKCVQSTMYKYIQTSSIEKKGKVKTSIEWASL